MLGRVSTEMWNEVGQSASDHAPSVPFPGGLACSATGKMEDQPDLVGLSAEPLESDIYLRLSPDTAKRHVRGLHSSAKLLRPDVDVKRASDVRLEWRERARGEIATGA